MSMSEAGHLQWAWSEGETTFVKEQPADEQAVGSFWLQRSEVTNQQMDAVSQPGSVLHHRIPSGNKQTMPTTQLPMSPGSKPIVMRSGLVGGYQPKLNGDMCAFADDNRSYAWGDEEPSSQNANFNNPAASEVGSYPAGAGVEGLLDFSGNVAEWTSSLEMPYPYTKGDGREETKTDGRRIAEDCLL